VVRVLDAVPAAGGAAVMGAGIVSIGLVLAGHEIVSRVLLGVDAALWLGLCLVFARKALALRDRWLAEARTPASLTAVAGTAVLGARLVLLGANGLGAALLALAFCVWLALLWHVVRHWQTPTVGVSFVTVVSTESLAVLAALLAFERGVRWLAVAAAVLLVVGVAAYGVVLARFDLGQLRTGRGDHWVSGGALAIAALACARVEEAARATAAPEVLRRAAADGSFVLWLLAMAWLPALLAAEALAPRFAYDTRRWSTVFPVGMYAVCSITVAQSTGIGALGSFGRAWIWVALALWAVVFAGMLRRGVELAALPVSSPARSGRRAARS
jgi:tellurite resistance protein TehA-like permease